MPSRKRLSSVCHSIAHHAGSGLSWLHPHLFEACTAFGTSAVLVEIHSELYFAPSVPLSRELAASLDSLVGRFKSILQAEGFSAQDVERAAVLFEYPPQYTDGFSVNCHARLSDRQGNVYTHSVDYTGRAIAPRFETLEAQCRVVT